MAKPIGEWWSTYFDAGYVREYEPLFDLVSDRRQVARLIELLQLESGARILDVPCGQGRHAHLLAEAGFDVDGLDLSAHLIALAKQRGTAKNLRYRRGDMRRLPANWTGRFDAVLDLFTSFGFFADARDDAKVIHEFARVLKPGGVLVWHGGSRDGVMAKFLPSDWWQTKDGTIIAQDREFDPLSGFLTIKSLWQGKRGTERRDPEVATFERGDDGGLVHQGTPPRIDQHRPSALRQQGAVHEVKGGFGQRQGKHQELRVGNHPRQVVHPGDRLEWRLRLAGARDPMHTAAQRRERRSHTAPHLSGAENQHPAATQGGEFAGGPSTVALVVQKRGQVLSHRQGARQAPLADLRAEGFVVARQQGAGRKGPAEEVSVHAGAGGVHPPNVIEREGGWRAKPHVGVGPVEIRLGHFGSVAGPDFETRAALVDPHGEGVAVAVHDEEASGRGGQRHGCNGRAGGGGWEGSRREQGTGNRERET
jgi:SAM-dependent methyltransferase